MPDVRRGVVYVAIGGRAQVAQARSEAALRRHNSLPVKVVDSGGAAGTVGRAEKIAMWNWSPFDETLYLDADTIPAADVSPLFAMLADGWDVVMAASGAQGDDCMMHIDPRERGLTRDEIDNPEPLQPQAGVIAWRRSDGARRLFAAWRDEWLRFRGQDQAALIRALYRTPECRVWWLGRPWNGGELIEHRQGEAAQ